MVPLLQHEGVAASAEALSAAVSSVVKAAAPRAQPDRRRDRFVAVIFVKG